MAKKAKPEAGAVTDAGGTAKEVRQIGRPFKAGAEWNGNSKGRPAGSRNVFCKQMLNDFAEVWREAKGKGGKPAGLQALRTLRDKEPGQFVRAAMNWVPHEFDIGESSQTAFRQIWEALAKGKAPTPEAESGDDG